MHNLLLGHVDVYALSRICGEEMARRVNVKHAGAPRANLDVRDLLASFDYQAICLTAMRLAQPNARTDLLETITVRAHLGYAV
jgi:hypothetical protein